MSLDSRLLLVSTEVLANGCHADIGTDHGLLPIHLLDYKICTKIIATEKSPKAYGVARQALWGRQADVRLGDGLEPLEVDEVQSVSVCGMGGTLIRDILAGHPEKLPPRVVVQANKDSFKIREWARNSGFHLLREQMVTGRWIYEVLTFHRMSGPDPAYEGVPLELGYHFGPHLLKEEHPILMGELQRRLSIHPEHPKNQDLRRVKWALDIL